MVSISVNMYRSISRGRLVSVRRKYKRVRTLNLVDCLVDTGQNEIITIASDLICSSFTGDPVRVEVNLNIRSMGPISELDMVRR